MNQMCKVCGEPAAGFHFGAFTCEGCKSFFGRSYNNLSSLGECKNNGNCVVNKKNRTSCKSCRLKKCLMVGMSKAGSRYGRRSNWFKIHCLIQEQQEKQQQKSQPMDMQPDQFTKELASSKESPRPIEASGGGSLRKRVKSPLSELAPSPSNLNNNNNNNDPAKLSPSSVYSNWIKINSLNQEAAQTARANSTHHGPQQTPHIPLIHQLPPLSNHSQLAPSQIASSRSPFQSDTNTMNASPSSPATSGPDHVPKFPFPPAMNPALYNYSDFLGSYAAMAAAAAMLQQSRQFNPLAAYAAAANGFNPALLHAGAGLNGLNGLSGLNGIHGLNGLQGLNPATASAIHNAGLNTMNPLSPGAIPAAAAAAAAAGLNLNSLSPLSHLFARHQQASGSGGTMQGSTSSGDESREIHSAFSHSPLHHNHHRSNNHHVRRKSHEERERGDTRSPVASSDSDSETYNTRSAVVVTGSKRKDSVANGPLDLTVKSPPSPPETPQNLSSRTSRRRHHDSDTDESDEERDESDRDELDDNLSEDRKSSISVI